MSESENHLERSFSQYNSPSYKSSSFKKIKVLKRGNFILRQELVSYTQECNPKCGIICNICLIIIFLAAGLPIIFWSQNEIEYKQIYTDCSKLTQNKNNSCSLKFNITEKLNPPIYLYYELDHFYLNHRALVKSKIWGQLTGEANIEENQYNKCKHAKYLWEMFGNDTSRYKSFTGNKMKADDLANPCGLIAKAFFNDTYSIKSSIGTPIFINNSRISNYFEKDNFYKRHPRANETQWIDVENEHFINWMAMETFSEFRKLWGRIDEELDVDVYTIEVQDSNPIAH